MRRVRFKKNVIANVFSFKADVCLQKRSRTHTNVEFVTVVAGSLVLSHSVIVAYTSVSLGYGLIIFFMMKVRG